MYNGYNIIYLLFLYMNYNIQALIKKEDTYFEVLKIQLAKFIKNKILLKNYKASQNIKNWM